MQALSFSVQSRRLTAAFRFVLLLAVTLSPQCTSLPGVHASGAQAGGSFASLGAAWQHSAVGISDQSDRGADGAYTHMWVPAATTTVTTDHNGQLGTSTHGGSRRSLTTHNHHNHLEDPNHHATDSHNLHNHHGGRQLQQTTCGMGLVACGATCMPPTANCCTPFPTPTASLFCPNSPCCGTNTCVRNGYQCCNSNTGGQCRTTQTCCQPFCCNPGFACVVNIPGGSGMCVRVDPPPSPAPPSPPPPLQCTNGAVQCGNACMPPGHVCCGTGTGTGAGIGPTGSGYCNSTAGESCCGTNGGCCGAGFACGGNGTCVPVCTEGTVACGAGCMPAGATCCGLNGTSANCPAGTTCCNGSCCAQGSACISGRCSSRSPGQTAPVYRLVCITKWNTTTGNLSVLHAGEFHISSSCQDAMLAGAVGVSNLDHSADPSWGNHAKVYDFLTLADYLNFTACNAAHPARPMLAVHEVWRREVVYAYNAPVSMPASGTQLHAALFLASPANRTTVASRLSGLTLDLSPIMDVNQAGVNVLSATLAGVQTPAPLADVAQLITFKTPQGVTAYMGYKNDRTAAGAASCGWGIPPNPAWTAVLDLVEGGPWSINAMAMVVKASP